MTARTFPSLVSLNGYAMPVQVSPGAEQRGHVIATRADRALSWLRGVTGKNPRFTLYIVGPKEWNTVADVPIYGMPQSVPEKIVTSPDPAAWWQEYLDALRPHLPAANLAEIARVYGDPPDLSTLADLIVTHELTHLFHEIDPDTWASEFPADWLMELFANIGMHGYLATHEPEHLALLSTMARATRAAGPDPWPMRDLAEMGQSMQASTTNYVWYEFMLIGIAESIWNAGGGDAMVAFQRLLGDPSLGPDAVMERLEAMDPTVGKSVRNWPAV